MGKSNIIMDNDVTEMILKSEVQGTSIHRNQFE